MVKHNAAIEQRYASLSETIWEKLSYSNNATDMKNRTEVKEKLDSILRICRSTASIQQEKLCFMRKLVFCGLLATIIR